jgi:hypothetical protein
MGLLLGYLDNPRFGLPDLGIVPGVQMTLDPVLDPRSYGHWGREVTFEKDKQSFVVSGFVETTARVGQLLTLHRHQTPVGKG